MSILIKGLQMPKGDKTLVVCINSNGTVDRPNWQWDCTLIKGAEAVELFDHGDLIDMAELWEKASRFRADAAGMVHLKTLTSKIDPSDYIAWNIRLDEREMFERMVESAPVVIPAESSEDGKT